MMGESRFLLLSAYRLPLKRAQAYSTFMAYAGQYTFTCDKVVHHVEVASLQNWVNTDQTRFVTVRGNRIFLRNTPQLWGGVVVTIESVWERLDLAELARASKMRVSFPFPGGQHEKQSGVSRREPCDRFLIKGQRAV